MWDDMDRLGQPAFHERACKVGSSAAPAHLFHDFPRHGQNMRSWSWIGQFLKFHDEFDVWEFGTAWNLSWKKYPGSILFWAFCIAGGDICVGYDQDLGDYSTRIDMYLCYLALTYLKPHDSENIWGISYLWVVPVDQQKYAKLQRIRWNKGTIWLVAKIG